MSKDIYWRRRAFVLIGVLLVFALIAYACNPSENEGESSSNQAGIEDPSASPSVPAQEPERDETAEPEEDASPSPSEDPSEGEDAEADEDSEEAGASGEGSAEAAAPERPEDPCRPQDVVISMKFAEEDREQYSGGANPGFRVTVVNVGEQTCTVDVGPEAIELLIHSGDDRVYSTADCVEGEGREERRLDQGRPHEYTLTWARERSFTDCRSSSAKAQPGWYKANLKGDLVSGVDQLVFQLKG